MDQKVGVPYIAENVAVRDNEAHRPAGTLDRSVIDIASLPFEIDRHLTRFAAEHCLVELTEMHAVTHTAGQFVHRLLHYKLRRSIKQETSRTAEYHTAGIRVSLVLLNQFAKPLNRDIGGKHCGSNARCVLDRKRECRHHDLSATNIDIGL